MFNVTNLIAEIKLPCPIARQGIHINRNNTHTTTPLGLESTAG
jgi:hypothetical protein